MAMPPIDAPLAGADYWHPGAPTATPSWNLAVLEEHQARRRHIEQLGRRPLSLPLRCLLWSLRAYVLFMMVVIAVSVWQTLH